MTSDAGVPTLAEDLEADELEGDELGGTDELEATAELDGEDLEETEDFGTFASLGLAPELVEALESSGIASPFAIQAKCIPPALEGRDLCGKAQTGSGKTLAFGLPTLMVIDPGTPRKPRALVLVPTRKLALQVCKVLVPLGQALGKRVVALYGGAPMEAQIKKLRAGVDIVVATPGRLIDLGDRGDVDVSDVQVLVLDEADRMADMGFLPQVEWVLRRLTDPHQTMLFSATLDTEVDHLVRTYLHDPVFCEVVAANETVEEMEHRFLAVHQMDKVRVAAAISKASYRTLMFVRTKRGADRLVGQLVREGVKAAAIHGDLRQSAREHTLRDFTSGSLAVLVATDVAARGIHVDAIDVVVHYDPPEDHKAYLHRSGRTARAGEAGLVVTLVLWDQQLEVEKLMKRVGLHQRIVEMFSNDARLSDLRSWYPQADAAGEGSSQPEDDGEEDERSTMPSAATGSDEAGGRPSGSGAPDLAAVVAARAAVRRNAMRSMGGRRRGRR